MSIDGIAPERLRTASLWSLFIERVVLAPASIRMNYFSGLAVLIGLVPVHGMLAIYGGNAWSWGAVIANPIALYFLLRGWLRMQTAFFFGGVVLALLANFGPLYLPPL